MSNETEPQENYLQLLRVTLAQKPEQQPTPQPSQQSPPPPQTNYDSESKVTHKQIKALEGEMLSARRRQFLERRKKLLDDMKKLEEERKWDAEVGVQPRVSKAIHIHAH